MYNSRDSQLEVPKKHYRTTNNPGLCNGFRSSVLNFTQIRSSWAERCKISSQRFFDALNTSSSTCHNSPKLIYFSFHPLQSLQRSPATYMLDKTSIKIKDLVAFPFTNTQWKRISQSLTASGHSATWRAPTKLPIGNVLKCLGPYCCGSHFWNVPNLKSGQILKRFAGSRPWEMR